MNHIGKSYNKDISLSHYSFELRNIVLHFTLKVIEEKNSRALRRSADKGDSWRDAVRQFEWA